MEAFVAAFFLVSALIAVSSAQPTIPRAELFGGDSFLRADGNPLPGDFNLMVGKPA